MKEPNIANSINSEGSSLSEVSRKMIVDSLRGVIERKKEAQKNHEELALPEEYYDMVQHQIEKYDLEHKDTAKRNT